VSPAATKTRPTTSSLQADGATLKAAAAWVARALPARTPVPLLTAIVLQADSGVLTLSGFDFATYVSAAVPVAGGFEGRVCVPGRFLADALGKLPAGPVVFTLEERELIVTAGRARFAVRLMDGAQYPKVPAAAPTRGDIHADVLSDAIHQAATCLSRDTLKEAHLTCLWLNATDGALTVWASDRYRGAQITVPWAGKPFEAFIPGAMLATVVKGLSGTLTLGADDNLLTLTGSDRTVTLVKAAGENMLPNLARLWAPPRQAAMHAGRDELEDALTTARLGVADLAGVGVDVTSGSLAVTGSAVESTGHVEIDAVSEVDLHLRVNATALADIVAVLPGPRVHIAFDDLKPAVRPFEIRPADTDGVPLEGATYIFVPIRENAR